MLVEMLSDIFAVVRHHWNLRCNDAVHDNLMVFSVFVCFLFIYLTLLAFKKNEQGLYINSQRTGQINRPLFASVFNYFVFCLL
jgi:hypothetical protein